MLEDGHRHVAGHTIATGGPGAGAVGVGVVAVDTPALSAVEALSVEVPACPRVAENLRWQVCGVDKAARARLTGHRPCVVWLTGVSGAGKSTIANEVERRLHAVGCHTYLLDGDNVRHGLSRDLGFSAADRAENIRRVGEVAALMVDAGLIVVCSFISPFAAERREVRARVAPGEFIEVFVDVPIEVAEARDPKGLYRKARQGLVREFTGIDSPYETPQRAEVHLDAWRTTPEQSAQAILDCLAASGILEQ